MILVYPDKHAVPELPPAIWSFSVDRVIGGASLHAALPYGVRERHGGRDEKCVVIRCPIYGSCCKAGFSRMRVCRAMFSSLVSRCIGMQPAYGPCR